MCFRSNVDEIRAGIRRMEARLKHLRTLPPAEARRQARRFLVGAGIITKAGKLAKPYR